jgi:hypothetical protein
MRVLQIFVVENPRPKYNIVWVTLTDVAVGHLENSPRPRGKLRAPYHYGHRKHGAIVAFGTQPRAK